MPHLSAQRTVPPLNTHDKGLVLAPGQTASAHQIPAVVPPTSITRDISSTTTMFPAADRRYARALSMVPTRRRYGRVRSHKPRQATGEPADGTDPRRARSVGSSAIWHPLWGQDRADACAGRLFSPNEGRTANISYAQVRPRLARMRLRMRQRDFPPQPDGLHNWGSPRLLRAACRTAQWER
ncbi:MAG: hypothetical protein QOH56_3528 [Pseudonocardiales bacterium]|nr:hypothetical protein [Pseudonocardiales bacterium]